MKSVHPEMHYPLIESQLDSQKIVTVHGRIYADIFNTKEQEVILVNGAMEESLVVKVPEAITVSAKVQDCLGNLVKEETITLNKGLNELAIPTSGYITLVK